MLPAIDVLHHWRRACKVTPWTRPRHKRAGHDGGIGNNGIDLTTTPSFRLDGRRALVTGGGRGIGLTAASALADAGAHVTLAARTASEIEEAADAIRARGQQADALTLDVTDIDAVRKALAGARALQILVNNAGTNRPALCRT